MASSAVSTFVHETKNYKNGTNMYSAEIKTRHVTDDMTKEVRATLYMKTNPRSRDNYQQNPDDGNESRRNPDDM